MTKRLLSLFNTYFFALLLLPFVAAFIPVQSFGQSAGDVAFIGFNGEGSASDDGFAVVLLTSYSADEEIHFSSQEWDGSTFAGPGGDFIWVAPTGGTVAGTVLVFSDVEDSENISVNVGTISAIAQMNLSGSGDIIYAYTGDDKFTPDTPFLGAIATDGALYTQPDGTEGTLANTGLTEAGNETILLPTDIDNAEYIGDRSGNTPNGYRVLLNDIDTEGATDDNWDIYNGSSVAPFPPFDDTSFAIVSAPTVAFTSSTALVNEDGTSIDLTVELVEANSTAIDVDVVFLGSSSSAVTGDIDSYTTQTVSFADTDASGTLKTVTITVRDDTDFEGAEKAVFQLQNNTAGSIISPDVLTLTINDNDAPDVVINEILYDPAGDANNDGTTDTSDDEFVEFVNNSSADIDISSWTLEDATSTRFTFPVGTVIPAGKAFVVFDESAKGTVFGGANLFAAGTLSLNNGGDTITLKDAGGNTVVSETYSGSQSDESITRDPDLTGSFTGHTTADNDDSSPFSPGTQINGTAFGSATYAIGIRGSEGWRMISSPTQSTTFNDLFSDLWTQGITGSDDPSGGGTQFGWTETGGGSFIAPGSMETTMTPGKGYIVYVFEDDELNAPGVQGGFPKTISTSNTENSSPVSVAVSANDQNGNSTIDGNEGWNLLGNPFGTDISVDALFTALEAVDPNVNTNISVWNPDTDSWEILTKGNGERLAPFQAFFMRYENASGVTGSVNLDRSSLAVNQGTEFFKQSNETKFAFDLSITDQDFTDKHTVEFSSKATTELDRYDAYKLFSLNTNAINLYSIVGNNKLLKNALPERPGEIIEIPLAFDAPNRNKLTFRWEGIRELPQHWDVTLIDRTLGRELDLRRDEEYTFTFQQATQQKAFDEEEKLYKKTPAENGDVRFVLRVNPGQIENSSTGNLPSSNQLNPNYPNPFNPTTTISYSLTQETQVKISVWNIVGQKVATLVDGVVEAGTHTELWNASDMPSGIYIAQMEVGGNVYIRKMTLIK